MKRWLAIAGLLSLLVPPSRAAAQTETGRITGTITALEGGNPVAGARVFIVGSRQIAETNPQGRYTLTVAPGTYRLRVSAIGYTPTLMDSVPVTANQATTANFQLKHQTIELEKVVVVGYGTQAKRDVTGAVGQVSSEQIQSQPVTNVVEAIKGRVPGVDIMSTGYKPGDGIQIRIRGTRSLKASNDPLYVLDGVPMAGGIGDLNPSDIESIEILKDASATAIYGSRGANGVVLVTSKKGNSSGRTRVSYDTYAALQSATKKVNVFDAAGYAEYKREAYRTAGLYNSALCGAGVTSCAKADTASNAFYAQELTGLASGVNTDWQDLIRRNGNQISHQLAIAGGNATTNYAASGNLTRQTGIVLGQDYDRKSLRVNVESQAIPRLRLGGSAMIVRSTQNVGRGDGLYSETLADSPVTVAYDSTTGSVLFKPTPDPQRDNPLSDVANHFDERVRTRLFGTLTATATLAEGLDYRVNFGPDITYSRRGIFHGAETSALQGSPADASINNGRTIDYTLDNILSYRRGLGADHKIDATLLYSIERNSFEGDSIVASNLPYETQRFYNLGSAGTVSAIGSLLTQWVLQSYMGRLNYTFRDRYLVTLTGRMDGSSRLAEGHKYNFFPSVALGWRVVDEAFGQPIGPLNSLKLRASYGRTGNTAVDPYQTLGGLTRTAYAWGSTIGAYGFRPGSLANPNLAWETTAQLDGGADFTLWGGKLSGTLDLYRANTDQLLMNRQLPTSIGFSSVTQNIGATRNTGIELALTHQTLDGGHGVRWTNDVSFSANKNEVVSLSNGPVDDIGNRWFIGQPINSTTSGCSNDCVWYDYRFLGIWQANQADSAAIYGQVPGQIRVQDVNGDGKINELDRQILGTTYPKWTGSINSRVDYGRMDFSVQVMTRQGFMINNTFRTSQSTLAGRYNGIAVNYWTPTNPSNTDPRPNKNQESPIYGDARGYEDGSFTRVRNITLGFSVPDRYLTPLGAQSLRIYGTAQNPFTFTKSTVLDPEGRASAGVPAYRSILLGANVGF